MVEAQAVEINNQFLLNSFTSAIDDSPSKNGLEEFKSDKFNSF